LSLQNLIFKPMAKPPTVLITGASGFLGSTLAHYLHQKGFSLFGIDNKPALDPSIYINYASSNVSTVDFEQFIGQEKLELCFHLAGSASVPHSLSYPFDDFIKLMPGTARCLDYIRSYQPGCHFILFSSAAIYGNPKAIPISEDTPSAPLSPYGAHKVLAEQMLQSYSNIFGLKGSILRIFSAYGAGLRKQLFWDVLSRYYRDELKSTLTLLGSGRESRDFIHARDVAVAALLIGQHPPSHGVAIYNVASGTETTIYDAVETLMAEKSITICFSGHSQPGSPSRWSADISRLNSLGFTRSITLRSGLADYLSWFEAQRQLSEHIL
jgi:UDP-glucose 4-epimerase